MQVHELHPTKFFIAHQNEQISNTTAKQVAQTLEQRETSTSTLVMPIVCAVDWVLVCRVHSPTRSTFHAGPLTPRRSLGATDLRVLVGCYYCCFQDVVCDVAR